MGGADAGSAEPVRGVTVIRVDPVAKPRMTRRDVWKKRPSVLAYRAYADTLRARYAGPLPDEVVIIFTLPMPRSWSARKRDRMRGQPHRAKPDLDNLEKAVLDALHPRDQEVWRKAGVKIWGDAGSVTIMPWRAEVAAVVASDHAYGLAAAFGD